MTQTERSLINRSTDEEISAATTSREVYRLEAGRKAVARKRERKGTMHSRAVVYRAGKSSSSRISAVKQVPRTARTAGRLGGSNGEQ